MINHAGHPHPSTPKARALCRANGGTGSIAPKGADAPKTKRVASSKEQATARVETAKLIGRQPAGIVADKKPIAKAQPKKLPAPKPRKVDLDELARAQARMLERVQRNAAARNARQVERDRIAREANPVKKQTSAKRAPALTEPRVPVASPRKSSSVKAGDAIAVKKTHERGSVATMTPDQATALSADRASDRQRASNNIYDEFAYGDKWFDKKERGIDRKPGVREYFANSTKINTALREGNVDPEMEKTIAEIDDAFKLTKTKEPLVVFRGVNKAAIGAGVGGVVKDDIYLSTAVDPQQAKKFARSDGSVMLHIELPAGTNVIAENNTETEVLLPRGTAIQITGRDGDTVFATLADAPPQVKSGISIPHTPLLDSWFGPMKLTGDPNFDQLLVDQRARQEKREQAKLKKQQSKGGGLNPVEGTSLGTHRVPTSGGITKSVRSGIRSRQQLSGGVVAETSLVEFRDGSKGVRKVAPELSDDIREAIRQDQGQEGLDSLHTPKMQQDAEELASMLGRMMGLKAPQVHRVNDNEVVMEFMPGTVASKLNANDYEDNADTLAIGLLDQIIGNQDRNEGNWLVDPQTGKISIIDHGLSWSKEVGGLNGKKPVRGTDIFALQFVSGGGDPDAEEEDDVPAVWKDVDLHPDDISNVRGMLDSLKPEFDKRGQLEWWNYSVEQLEAIRPHAVGEKRRIR